MEMLGLLVVHVLRLGFAMLKKDLKVNPVGLINYLVRDGILHNKIASEVIIACEKHNIQTVSYLVKNKILSSQMILQYCEKKFNLSVFDLHHYDTRWLSDTAFTVEFIYRNRVLPLQREHNNLYVGISDPTDHATLALVSFHTGLRIKPMLVSEIELEQIINLHCKPVVLDAKLQNALSKIKPIEEPTTHLENNSQDDEPVIDFVNRLIQDALLKQASDIHIEPYEKHCRVRFRRDGLLFETTTLPLPLAIRIITRLKIMANLNIAERRIPQDGRINLNETRDTSLWDKSIKVDIRVNVCPTVCGEKVVLRLLDSSHIQLDIDHLGLTVPQKNLFLQKLHQPQGLILVTGPTGSGKTVTLYSALHYLNQAEKNISSVEDPVEISLHGINQVNVNPKIGLDFAKVLRTFLRQDPDIIMVGEIRDSDTAHIAIQAAQTGHLVLSTLHANNALETFNRLDALGVSFYNLLQSSPLLIAQRLLRKLCPICKQPNTSPQSKLSQHETTLTYHAIGCGDCQQGYKGRIGIFELIAVTSKMCEQINANVNIDSIRNEAKKDNFMLLSESGMLKVREGITSLEELRRVIGDDNLI
jgi:type IV pilus assembly protein PilB